MAATFTNLVLTQMERDLPKMLSELPEISELKNKESVEAQRASPESTGSRLQRFKELVGQRIDFAEVMEQNFYRSTTGSSPRKN